MPGPENRVRHLTPEQLAKVEEGLNRIHEILTNRPIEILGEEGMQKAFLHGYFELERKETEKARTCVVPGCCNRSIRRSHTLQRNGPLAAIAENGHVLKPAFDPRTFGQTLERIGIGYASTFPGFCALHERLFFSLEQRRALDTDSAVHLQVFRAVCREMVVQRQERDTTARFLRAWRIVVHYHGTKILCDVLGPELTAELKPASISTDGSSPLEVFLASELAATEEHLRFLQNVMLPQSFEALEHPERGLAHYRLDLNIELPVCLAGLGNFHMQTRGRIDRVFAMLNVWPGPGGTVVVMSVPAESGEHLRDFFLSRLNRSLGALEMVETWMTNGTNHWFIRPSVWAKIPSKRAARILSHIRDTHHDLGSPYHLSIFDEIRKSLLGIDDPDTDAAAETAKLA